MQAFVTGSTGLVGSNLVRLLVEQGHSVKALARSKEKADKVLAGIDNVTVVQGDLENIDAFAHELEGCDWLFHTAAYFREYYGPGEHWDKLKRLNVDATIQLLTEAEKRGIQRAVHTSSGGVIGDPVEGEYADERSKPGAISMSNLYFKSKVLCEEAIAEWLNEHSMPVTLILPGWIYGPSDAAPTASGRIVLDFLNRKLPAILPGGVSIVDARDVAKAMIAAAEKGQSGERYIIGGNHHTLESVMKTLGEISGVPAPKLKLPYPAALAMAYVSELAAKITRSAPQIPLEGIRTLNSRHQVTSAKAERELGTTFRPLEETLRDEVAWFRANGYA